MTPAQVDASLQIAGRIERHEGARLLSLNAMAARASEKDINRKINKDWDEG